MIIVSINISGLYYFSEFVVRFIRVDERSSENLQLGMTYMVLN